MDESRDSHTEWSKSERERQILYGTAANLFANLFALSLHYPEFINFHMDVLGETHYNKSKSEIMISTVSQV